MKLNTILVLLLILCACNRTTKTVTGLEGQLLPSFHLLLPDSTTAYTTDKTPSGHPIILFYFGPYCPYSRAEMEDILQNMSSLKNVQFCIFTTSPMPEMRMFYDHYNLKSYENIVTGIDYTNFFNKYFNPPGVPYLALYNSKRQLKQVLVGKSDISAIKAMASE